MRVLYMIDKANLYGSEKHLLELIEYMKKENEICVFLFSEGELINELEKRNIKHEIIKINYFINTLFDLYELIIKTKKFNPDIIHSHQPKALLYGNLLSKLFGIKSIITIHSQAKDHAIIHSGIRKKIVWSGHFILNFINQFLANDIIFVSKYMYKKKLFNKKSHLVYNWISPEIMKNDYIYINNPNKEVIKILTVGSITYSKGYDIFINFINLLYEKVNKDIHIYILGEGEEDYVKSLKNKIKKPLRNNVYFLGYKKNVSFFYSMADCFVLFSRSETFGLVYAEAMYFGLPIFAGDLKVLKEIVPNNNFLSYDLEKQVYNFIRLFNNEYNFKKIKKANKNQSAKFNYYNSMNKIYNIYQ